MKKALLMYGFSAVIASSLLMSSPSSAKTVKACEEEWKANKTTIQTSGKKKKDFITECRAETASTEPSAAPAAQATPAETPNSSATAPRTRSAKTIRACAAEWTANKEALQASGKTRAGFITECRGGAETAAAAPATPAAPSTGMTPSATPTAGRKTVKACDEEWKANKAAIQASGKKKTDFITECRGEPGSTQAAAPAPQSKPADQPKPDVATAPQSTPTAQPKTAAAPPSTAPAQPRSEAAPAPQGPTASLATRAIYIGGRREISLPRRYGRVGQYTFAGLSLRYEPQIRTHEDRCVYVREGNCRGRHEGGQEGKAPLKSSCGPFLLLMTRVVKAPAGSGIRAGAERAY